MRTSTTGIVLLGLVAALATAPVALAETPEPTTTEPTSSYPPPSPSIHITGDGRPQPGDEIGVVVRCPFEPQKATSPVLTIGEFEQVETPAGINTYVAPATIDPATEPGDYPLHSWCGRGHHLRMTFTVYPADAEEPTTPPESSAPAAEPPAPTIPEKRQVSRIPKGAPETGGGPVPVGSQRFSVLP